MATDLLARIRGELEQRMAELRPLLGEYERLIAAADTLADMDVQAPPPAGSPTRATGAQPAKRTLTPRRGRRPRGSAAGAIERAAAAEPQEPPEPEPTATPARPIPEQLPHEQEDRPPRPASQALAQQAILAALEHGSHTTSELAMVTAMSGSDIRRSLSRLTRRGAVIKVKRDGDGKGAYALPSAGPRS